MGKTQKTIKIVRCTECPHHRIERDPDPDDWFCDDDVKLVCQSLGREVGGALRPYEVDEVEIPKWCPL